MLYFQPVNQINIPILTLRCTVHMGNLNNYFNESFFEMYIATQILSIFKIRNNFKLVKNVFTEESFFCNLYVHKCFH